MKTKLTLLLLLILTSCKSNEQKKNSFITSMEIGAGIYELQLRTRDTSKIKTYKQLDSIVELEILKTANKIYDEK